MYGMQGLSCGSHDTEVKVGARGARMQQDRGVALILALLVLSFLTVLSGALLSTSTIDIWISDNYKSAAQSLYLAEAGLSQARETIHSSGLTLSDLLARCAGPDHQLAT